MKKMAMAVLVGVGMGAWGKDCTDWVDVFTGTGGTGHTHPAASAPFGMVQAGPDTGYGDWAYCSGYQYGDKEVYGYSQNHLSGTGCPDLGDVQILPYTGELGKLPAKRRIDKATERGEPGYYTVAQPDDGLTVEVAASKRAAIYRFKGGAESEIRVLVNLPSIIKANWGKFFTASADVAAGADGASISGSMVRRGWTWNRPISFSLRFNRKWERLERLEGVEGDAAPRYAAVFGKGGELMAKVALSLTSGEAAAANLEAEIPHWNLEKVRRETKAEWEELLGRTTAEGDDVQLTNWYTALYHMYLQPSDYSDAGKKPRYTAFSLWDTFRAAHPWYTIATPEIVEPAIESMLDAAERDGKIASYSVGGSYVDCMVGNHAAAVIADAYFKGFKIDAERAFGWVTNSITVAHGRAKEDWAVLDKYGYYPFDLVKRESVSRTLECCYDDWCAAKMAGALGKKEAEAFFLKRSRGWRNLWDAGSGFMRAKDSKGRWREPFNPFELSASEKGLKDFTEGNAFQYSWFVLHEPEALIEAMGGRERFAEKLEGLFLQPETAEGMGKSLDVTGLIGQYVHGNEPSHHIIYFFRHAGRADLCAKYVRKVFDTQYAPGPEGLCGNDDCGQMSAWLAFSAAGFYPFDPCSGEYVLGAPQVRGVRMRLGNGKEFRVTAKNLSKRNYLVKGVKLNGRKFEGWKIRHADVMAGGELEFEMGE